MNNNSQYPPSSPISGLPSDQFPTTPDNYFNDSFHNSTISTTNSPLINPITSSISSSTPTSSSQSFINRSKSNESFIWRYGLFRLIESEDKTQYFMCTACNKKYKKNPSSRSGYGTLYHHLKVVHKITKNDETALLNKHVISNGKDIKKLQNEYNLRLAKWVVSDFQPFTSVDAPSFKLAASFNQEFKLKIPSSSTIKRIIQAQYTTQREQMKSILATDCAYISLITDIWTAKDKKSYMGVIGSFIDQNFVRKEVLLDFFYIGPHHSGRKIHEYILKTIGFYHLEEKIVSIVTDNATNNKAAIGYLEKSLTYEFHNSFRSADQWIRCGCHIINLIAKRITKSINSNHKKHFQNEIDSIEENNSPIIILRSLILKIRTNEASLEEWSLTCARVYSGLIVQK